MARPKKEDTTQQRVSPTVERVTPSAQPMRRPDSPYKNATDTVAIRVKETNKIVRYGEKYAKILVSHNPKLYEFA